ncbi:MAG: hypothetical protein EPO26_13810 [Chloroflexota bacterium]|nr:MAG: hypothetical protein EPO26_13810 [Chloroflexota bacterium]
MLRAANLHGRGRILTREALALLAVSVLALTGCEYPGIPHPQAAARMVSASRDVTTAPSAAPKSQSAAVLQGRVPVSQKDFKLSPDDITARAGSITFVLKNEGLYTHDFRVEGEGVDEKAPKVGSGRTIEWRISLTPGSYRISCPVSNHADRGMTGSLTVVS